MTHQDIFTKFMIEYDKANVTSSYPSLTEYEIATVLDKAYMALIAQKFTGNNIRRVPFEQDSKNIVDLQPLIVTETLKLLGKNYNPFKKLDDELDGLQNAQGYGYEPNSEYDYGKANLEINLAFTGDVRSMPDNMRSTTIPIDMLYFVSAYIPVDMHKFAGWMNDENYVTGMKLPTDSFPEPDNTIHPLDNKNEDYEKGALKRFRIALVVFVNHQIAEKFFASAYNIPWVKHPVAYMENNRLFVIVDPIVGIPELPYTATINENGIHVEGTRSQGEYISLTYIRKPNTFVKDLTSLKSYLDSDLTGDISYSKVGTIKGLTEEQRTKKQKVEQLYNFELNDTVAEELISLAITYALENVESPRLNAHLGIRGLES